MSNDALAPRERDAEAQTALATRWFAGALVAAICVLALLARLAQGETWLVPIAVIAIVLLVTFAQYQFQETHRRRHHRWPPGLEGFWTGSPERAEVIRAWTHRDPVAPVELSRLVGLALLGFALVAAVVVIAAASTGS